MDTSTFDRIGAAVVTEWRRYVVIKGYVVRVACWGGPAVETITGSSVNVCEMN